MAYINLKRRAHEDGLRRAECLRAAAYYDSLKPKFIRWVDGLSRQDLLRVAHAVQVQNVPGLKQAVIDNGLQEIEEAIKYWRREAESRIDPHFYV